LNEIQSFWEEKHREENLLSLSGCYFKETIDFLRINEFIKNDIKVLEVGCGMGYVTEEISKFATIDVVDISTIALNRVRKFCNNVYHADSTGYLKTNSYDLIICNNTAQHIPDNDLKEEMVDFIRSLKWGGVFAIEFVSSTKEFERPLIKKVRGGIFCRSEEEMMKLVAECGGYGKVVFDDIITDNRIVTGVHVMHIVKV
jgi:SAM-dependent methyltransferase